MTSKVKNSCRLATAECVFAIVSATDNGPVSSEGSVDTALAHRYRVEAYESPQKDPQGAKQQVCARVPVAKTLIARARKQPNKSKDTVKLLLNDYSATCQRHFHRSQIRSDCSYSSLNLSGNVQARRYCFHQRVSSFSDG
jgi:hypothetical protein